MDLTYSELHHEAQKVNANQVHKDFMSFCGKNEALEAFKCLKASKAYAPKMLEKTTSSIYKDATYKG